MFSTNTICRDGNLKCKTDVYIVNFFFKKQDIPRWELVKIWNNLQSITLIFE